MASGVAVDAGGLGCFINYCDSPGGKADPVGRKCCLSQQLRSPEIEGGRFSVKTIDREVGETAMDVWNPKCVDVLGQVPHPLFFFYFQAD